jgi:hypothetical protein
MTMTSRFPKISYNHDSKTGETRISEIEGFTNINTTIKKDVKGCGCRFLNGKICEHLCAHHTQEFITQLYNNNEKEKPT